MEIIEQEIERKKTENGIAVAPPRSIRSFVLRQGRITPAQAKALQEDWSTYGIALKPSADVLDWAQLFGRQAPRVLEIGFGMGDVLIASACADPQTDFIGVEVHPPGVGKCIAMAKNHQLRNLKIVQDDICTLLPVIPAHSLDHIWIFFPDPWPKKRHQKRRLIQPAFLNALSAVLKPNGMLHLATDWHDYADHMLATLEVAPGYVNVHGAHQFAPHNVERLKSKFQRRGERLGHGLWELQYRRAIP